METMLLATKLFIPQVSPSLVVRPRLMQQLQDVLNNRLTLVSAPAGFGKTTILSQWIQENRVPTTWLSLEEAENDPARFWDYFIGALRKLSPSIGEKALSLLHSSQPVPIESTLTVLVNDIADVQEDFVFVLDDYHVIESETVDKGITFLLDHLPPKMHLVIATREDPPLPLARFRGKGVILEIGADDLRFNREETSSLLQTLLGLELSPEDVRAINTRAEGWVVGLKMAALSLGKQKDIKQSIAAFTGSQRYVMDYLMDEVLRQQPTLLRDFLLKTSILDGLNGPLCDAVTQRTGGDGTLVYLEKANLFIIPLDESRELYRYHHLFAELLRHQLDLEYGKETVSELHRKASQWYQDNKLPHSAINHALAAKDWARAMALIGRSDVLVPLMRTQTLLNWLQRIPEDILRTNIERYINYIWTLEGTGQYVTAERCLDYLDTVTTEGSYLKGSIANLRASIALGKGDIPHAEEYAQKALSLSDTSAFNEQAVASVVLGATLSLQGRNNEAESFLRKSAELFQHVGQASNIVQSLTWLGTALFGQGKLYEAVETYKQVIELAGEDPATGMAHLGLGSMYYQWNDLAAAVKQIQQAVELSQLSKNWGLENAYFSLARTLAASGDFDGALKTLQDADFLRSRRSFSASSQATSAANHAAITLLLGEKEAASRLIGDLAESDILQLLTVSISVVRLFWSKKDRKVVAVKAETLREQYQKQKNLAAVACIRIIQALDSLGPDNPLDCLSEALSICKSANAIRVFVDIGAEIVPLLKQAFSQNIEPAFARKLVTIIEAEEQQRQVKKGKGVPIPRTSEFLSLRELEVLQLASTGLSNNQIAEKLIISLSTAKSHIHNITQKLGARNRTQAIARARELKLI